MGKPAELSTIEYWVVRVITRLVDGKRYAVMYSDLMAPATRAKVDEYIAAGRLAVLPDMRIVEPAEVYADEARAHAEHGRYSKLMPREEFAVIMNGTV